MRNKIDFLLSQKNTNWLESLPKDLAILEKKTNSSKDNMISKQSLRFWIKIIDHYKIHNQILDRDFLKYIDFKKYFNKNKNRFKKSNFRDYHKVKVILELLRLIRNRAFHFENLYKMNNHGPRLSTKITLKDYSQSIIISIHPNKIKDFLNDLLASFHKDLVFYADK